MVNTQIIILSNLSTVRAIKVIGTQYYNLISYWWSPWAQSHPPWPPWGCPRTTCPRRRSSREHTEGCLWLSTLIGQELAARRSFSCFSLPIPLCWSSWRAGTWWTGRRKKMRWRAPQRSRSPGVTPPVTWLEKSTLQSSIPTFKTRNAILKYPTQRRAPCPSWSTSPSPWPRTSTTSRTGTCWRPSFWLSIQLRSCSSLMRMFFGSIIQGASPAGGPPHHHQEERVMDWLLRVMRMTCPARVPDWWWLCGWWWCLSSWLGSITIEWRWWCQGVRRWGRGGGRWWCTWGCRIPLAWSLIVYNHTDVTIKKMFSDLEEISEFILSLWNAF